MVLQTLRLNETPNVCNPYFLPPRTPHIPRRTPTQTKTDASSNFTIMIQHCIAAVQNQSSSTPNLFDLMVIWAITLISAGQWCCKHFVRKLLVSSVRYRPAASRRVLVALIEEFILTLSEGITVHLRYRKSMIGTECLLVVLQFSSQGVQKLYESEGEYPIF